MSKVKSKMAGLNEGQCDEVPKLIMFHIIHTYSTILSNMTGRSSQDA